MSYKIVKISVFSFAALFYSSSSRELEMFILYFVTNGIFVFCERVKIDFYDMGCCINCGIFMRYLVHFGQVPISLYFLVLVGQC